MQPLEKALLDLTERAEPLPLDVLIHRVETQLALEGELPAITGADAATGIVQAPSHNQRPTTPLRRKAWAFAAAFVLMIASVGIAAVALRGDSLPMADEPATPTTAGTATPETPTAAASGEWEWMAVEEPWLGSVIDVAPLPGGGFVVAATDDWSVLWSPDGIEWRDADPQREVAVLPLTPTFGGSRPQAITAIADRVVVLDRTVFGIKIGDLETRSWDSIEFDTADLTENVGVLMVAANDTHLLAIGYEDDYAGGRLRDDGGRVVQCGEIAGPIPQVDHTRYLTWLVNPHNGEVRRSSLPAVHDQDVNSWAGVWAGARACEQSYGSLVWFKDQWVLNLGELVFVSPDGMTWTQTPNSSSTSEYALFNATLIPGLDTLIARGCGMGCGLGYSATGVGDWIEIPEPVADWVAYSDTIGYVSVGEYGESATPGISMSLDGRHFTMAEMPSPSGNLVSSELVASFDRAFGINEFGTAYLLIYTEPGDPGT